MRKSLLVLAGFIMLAGAAQAQFIRGSAGADAVFFKQSGIFGQKALMDISLQDDLGLAKNHNGYEIAGWLAYRGLAVHGYHLFNISMDGQGILWPGQYPVKPDEKDPKPIAVKSAYSFSASRIEIGLPIVVQSMVIEPFWVTETVRESLRIQGPGIDWNVTNNPNSSGVGVSALLAIGNGSGASLKYFKTGLEQFVDVKYLMAGPQVHWSLGYVWRQLQVGNIRCNMNGPMIEVGMVF